MATSIIINGTDQNNKAVAKSYTALNPDATDAQLRDFAKGVIGLSKHTLDTIYRVDKKDITFDPRDPQFTVTPNSLPANSFNNGASVSFTLSYLGEERTVTMSGQKPAKSTISSVVNKQFTIEGHSTTSYLNGSDTVTMTITLPATDDYDEATATITFTGDKSAFVDI